MLPHPHIYLTKDVMPGLRSLAQVRASLSDGLAGRCWQRMLAQAQADLQASPLLPGSDLPGRGPEHTAHANRDYAICQAAGDRMVNAALVALLTGDSCYREIALAQMEALFDDARWPDWRDMAHLMHPADLRTGMLGKSIGLAYDWLHPMLTDAERQWIIAGLERRAFTPFWEGVRQGSSWANGTNNWMTCIVGGLGIAAMALGDDYSGAGELIEYSLPRLLGYRDTYGPEGEFNESPGYAAANRLPVEYLLAHYYHTGGGENLLAQPPFPDACRWFMYLTLPPGRTAAFGDTHLDRMPNVTFTAAVAQAARDEVLQWYYQEHGQPAENGNPCFDLLWYDATLPARNPEGVLPRGRAFPAHSGCIVSRTDWNPHITPSVVYGKAGHGAEGHGNHDAGQVCIDGWGERLILDVGIPTPVYPGDFFSGHRYEYYNAAAFGHNVLVFGGREMRRTADDRAEIIAASFDDSQGGEWTLDLAGMYDGARAVRRTVVHRFPGIVAVLDEAELEREEEISLRWHTIDRAAPDADGRFTVRGEKASMAGRVLRLDGDITVSRGEHAYTPPYDRCRLGDPLYQPRESYIEARCTAGRCRLLSLFAVFPPGAEPCAWREDESGPSIDTPDGRFRVTLEEDTLQVRRDWAEIRTARFPENPLIRPGMPGLEGRNINGPTLLKVPAWVERPLGRYYLYFGDHRGQYLRLAYADDLHGPWMVLPGGVLHLDDAPGCRAHIASPEILVDDEQRVIRLYFHGPARDVAGQQSFLALSTDGLHFTAQGTVLAPFYLRVFRHGGWYYGLAKDVNRGGILYRSRDGVTPFEQGPEIIPRMRHCALLPKGDTLWVFFSRMGDAPERMLVTQFDLTRDWTAWDATAPPYLPVLAPELAYEGIDFPLQPSSPGAAVDVRQLRDPFVYEEDGRLYLFYTVAGETGIAAAELSPGDLFV